MSAFDPDMDLCQCGHVRLAHEADADCVGDPPHYVGYWLSCTGQDEAGVDCDCEEFEED